MPLQNRVLPTGEIVAIPERGSWMGNRGRIHIAGQRLGKRRWEGSKPWIICRLQWKGINRRERHGQLMSMNSYTELFFLDEVTALAAGHRPCAQCNKERYEAFGRAWAAGVLGQAAGAALAGEIDRALHAARIDEHGQQRRWEARLDEQPNGVILCLGDDPETLWLRWRGKLQRWTPQGYGETRAIEPGRRATVLTPRPTASVLAVGYVPHVQGEPTGVTGAGA